MTRNLNPAARMEKDVRRMAEGGGSGVEKDASEAWATVAGGCGGTATLRASVPADDAGVCVESGVGHPLVHAAIYESCYSEHTTALRIEGAQLTVDSFALHSSHLQEDTDLAG